MAPSTSSRVSPVASLGMRRAGRPQRYVRGGRGCRDPLDTRPGARGASQHLVGEARLAHPGRAAEHHPARGQRRPARQR